MAAVGKKRERQQPSYRVTFIADRTAADLDFGSVDFPGMY